MEYYICSYISIIINVMVHTGLNVEAEALPWMTNYWLKDHTNTGLLQQLSVARQKRNAPPQDPRAPCGCNAPPEGADKPSQPNPVPPNIVVHHYHYYYYCCPGLADQIQANSHLVHAINHDMAHPAVHNPPHPISQNVPHSVSQNTSHPKSSVTCECSITGFCTCGVDCQCKHGNKEDTKKPKQDSAFGFGMMFTDPIGKEFSEFISKNFVRRENPQQTNTCQSNPAPGSFYDPVCKDFFHFFSQNFMRKPETPTAAPTQPSTPAPTQPTNAGNTHSHIEFKEFSDMKGIFDAIRNEISKTAEMAKKL